jgi:cytochrome P450
MVYHTHRLPDLWPDPERFDPDRFADSSHAEIHPFAYLPFGAGARICLGAQLGPMVMSLALTVIFQRYRLEFRPQSADDPVADFGFEIHPHDGIRMLVRPASSQAE